MRATRCAAGSGPARSATAAVAATNAARHRSTGAPSSARRDAEFIGGCMLYWAEGKKHRNVAGLTNADADLLESFVRFLRRSFDVPDEKIAFSVNCFLGNGLSLAEIEDGGSRASPSRRRRCERPRSIARPRHRRAGAATRCRTAPAASRCARPSSSRASTARSRSTPRSTGRSGSISDGAVVPATRSRSAAGSRPAPAGATDRSGWVEGGGEMLAAAFHAARRSGPSGTRTQNHGINLPHRLSPATRARSRGLAVWTISSPSAGPVRVGGVWPLRALPHHAGLPADRPIPWDFHRPRGPVPRALRGFQQIAADELAVSRLALLPEVPCSAN